MIEITFFVPDYPSNHPCGTPIPENTRKNVRWTSHLIDCFEDYTEADRVWGRWQDQQEYMRPFTVLAENRDFVQCTVDTLKEIYGEEKVYVRYGEAEIL